MIVIAVVLVFMVLLGVFSLTYRIFKLVEMDAKSRGLKHPKFWGIFTIGGNGGGRLLLYLIGRNKYPSTMTDDEKKIFISHKRKSGLSLCFIAIGTIGLIFVSIFCS